MSAGERYGISTHLADPERVCFLHMCDGSGYYTVREDDGRERLTFHDEPCNHADHEGGCLGHPVVMPCLCTAPRRVP